MLKGLVLRLAYAGGAVPAWQRRRATGHLTVMMFHRVLSMEDERAATADRLYTVSDVQFDACVRHVTRYYDVVSLEDVTMAARGVRQLPRRPLLITFDDGWADNEEYALPILKKHEVPAVVFVAGGAIGRTEPFWQDAAYAAWACGRLQRVRQAFWAPHPPPATIGETEVRARIRVLASMRCADRQALLDNVDLGNSLRPAMLSVAQIRHLAESGVAIAAHGHSHEPLTSFADVSGDLTRSREAIRLAVGSGEGPAAMSFPHGALSHRAVAEARRAGFEVLFTSEPVLTPISAIGHSPLGRLEIAAQQICAGRGEVMPERLAVWLASRPQAASQWKWQ